MTGTLEYWKNPSNPLLDADDVSAEAWEQWILFAPKIPVGWPSWPSLPMYYSAGSGSSTADNLWQIGKATSGNGGYSWARSTGINPVIPKSGSVTSFFKDSILESMMCVFQGRLHCVFSGQNVSGTGPYSDGKVRLGYGESTDGLIGEQWNIQATPLMDVGGTFDSEQAAKGHLVQQSDTEWWLYYSAKPGAANDDWFTVALSKSTTGILGPYVKSGVIHERPGLFVVYPWVIKELDGSYTMYVQEGLNQVGGPYDLNAYRSEDGETNWRLWRMPIMRSPHTAYDDVYVGGGHCVLDFPSGPGGSLQRHLWYSSRISTDGDETGTYPFSRRYHFANHAIIDIPYAGGYPRA